MSEPKRNILPVVDDVDDKPRQRARTSATFSIHLGSLKASW